MRDLESARKKTIDSVNGLLGLLEKIKGNHVLNIEQASALQQDIEAIQEISSLLTDAVSKEQRRYVWEKLNQVKVNFGGYVGDEIGNQLIAYFEDLWKTIFDFYSKS